MLTFAVPLGANISPVSFSLPPVLMVSAEPPVGFGWVAHARSRLPL